MITKLLIENYALIDKLEIDFSGGFSVITGETGAGKSILLGALGLILGQRNDPSVMLDPERKCLVEGHFNISNYHLQDFFSQNDLDYQEDSILRREISQTGKSRAFINDTPVTLNILKELGEHLLNIHSQHSVITLNDANFQLAVIDDYAGNQVEVTDFRNKYVNYIRLKKKLEEFIQFDSKSQNDRDYYLFLCQELESAALKRGEQEELEQRLQILTHAEEIKTNLHQAIQILTDGESGLLKQLNDISNLSGLITKYYPDLAEISSRIRSDQIDLKDINTSFERIADEIQLEPEEMESVSNRLDLIYRMEKKHHVSSIEELINLKDEFRKKVEEFNSLETKIEDLKRQIDVEFMILSKTALRISSSRKKIIGDLEKNITSIIQELGMPDARVRIDETTLPELTRDGLDKVRFLFSSNAGIDLDDISRIASGGELSRLMLAIKSLISRKNLLPTIIFDEIDNGVSGNIAGKVGGILKKMSENMQVIAITHLPQIAGMGGVHYLVYKIVEGGMTRSLMKKLNRDERITEIASMLGNGKITVSATKMAAELLKN